MAVSDAYALVEILRHPGIESVELARHLGLSKSAVSRLVVRLKRRGQVVVNRSQKDGRAHELVLSAKGKKSAELIDHKSREMFAIVLSEMHSNEGKLLIDSLKRLILAITTVRGIRDFK